jgi:ABC-2 type transport system permease protein
VAVIQAAVLFAIGLFLGLGTAGNAGLVILIMLIMAIMYVALGMILGATFSTKAVPFAYMVILLLTIFGGAWMDLDAIGGVFRTAGDIFPFAHALDAARDVMLDGAGLGAVATHLYWILGYTVVIVALAILSFKRRMLE